ncbi:thiolase domain-containing protein [Brevibacillus sp. SYP-B805]|uniref:thiolase domain-containing protein n=1 Tax=Brevibacillus sp. SYP-B805 TaxID=1578199 RepID=UPI0013EBC29D|nr:thiolase domain-containing protein [Brevibacillus sp. SYP-B805]NGQ95198.1 thiolase domain-containing protein [Brevibacillus sp. SYP-B805]
MRQVSIIGVGCTPFGKLKGRSIKDLALEACREALSDAGVAPSQIEAFYLGNFAGGMLARQELTAALVAGALGIGAVPATRVEGACASGGIALRHGYLMIAAGCCDVVLVAGVEKMTQAGTEEVTAALTAAADRQAEGSTGLSFPGFFAAVARRYMHEYGATLDHLSAVAYKSRENAQRNPRAHFYGKPAALDAISHSRLIADPLRLYDCSPISDGASALVLVASERAKEFGGQPVDILGSAQATGSTTIQEMDDLCSLQAVVKAASQAYEQAGVGPEDVDVAEVHDCFSIAELIALEDLGIMPRGEAGPRAAAGETRVGGRVAVNPSGGLLSKGHPIGATGVAQVFEVVRQLRGEADNQVPHARIGLTHNVGGCGGVATVHILGAR